MGMAQKKKKVDYEALQSQWMQIPRMDVVAARALLDLGLRYHHQVIGRAPEVLYEEHRKQHPEAEAELLQRFRMAVYFAENDDRDPRLLHPSAWAD